jgi:hypothetical protein
MPGCSDPMSGVFGMLFLWTPTLVLFGELVIRADRRARYREAVLAEERQRIMRSVFDEPSGRNEPRACDRSASTLPSV